MGNMCIQWHSIWAFHRHPTDSGARAGIYSFQHFLTCISPASKHNKNGRNIYRMSPVPNQFQLRAWRTSWKSQVSSQIWSNNDKMLVWGWFMALTLKKIFHKRRPSASKPCNAYFMQRKRLMCWLCSDLYACLCFLWNSHKKLQAFFARPSWPTTIQRLFARCCLCSQGDGRIPDESWRAGWLWHKPPHDPNFSIIVYLDSGFYEV